MSKQTKADAHEKYLRWIEKHDPNDGWVVVGGDDENFGMYSATASKADNSSNLFLDSCAIKYGKGTVLDKWIKK